MQLIETWNSPSPDRELGGLQRRMLPYGKKNEYEAINQPISEARARTGEF